MTPKRALKVAIIGAGMSGICMAVKLQDAGIDSFTIFEKADDVGGTWRDNTYPGLTCDVPSRYYSYSFRPNPDWTHLLPPGPEIQVYFRQVAEERGIRPHIRFGTDVTRAEYDDGRWRLTTADGEETFDVLITATGVLRVPRYPEIAGLETFAGPAFHSSRWDHSISLPDKRIGLIGTGSTGVQIVAELGGKVHGLKVFQRTAQWICPVPNLRYSALTRAALRRWPRLNGLPYRFWGKYVRTMFGSRADPPGFPAQVVHIPVPVEPAALGARPPVAGQAHSEGPADVQADDLRRPLLPLRPPARGRGDHRPIDHIEPRGVVTADGTLHELDLLVYATGFDARAYVRPLTVIGEGGLTLDEAWADGPTAYRSVAVPGFPNLFMLMGPHSPIGNQSLVPIAEDQADYAMWWINQLRDGVVRAAAPTEAATKEYNESMKAAMPQTIWVTGCSSWYLGKDGLPELFPWTPDTHRELLRQPEPADFDVRTA